MNVAQWFIAAALLFMAAHTLIYTDSNPVTNVDKKGTCVTQS